MITEEENREEQVEDQGTEAPIEEEAAYSQEDLGVLSEMETPQADLVASQAEGGEDSGELETDEDGISEGQAEGEGNETTYQNDIAGDIKVLINSVESYTKPEENKEAFKDVTEEYVPQVPSGKWEAMLGKEIEEQYRVLKKERLLIVECENHAVISEVQKEYGKRLKEEGYRLRVLPLELHSTSKANTSLSFNYINDLLLQEKKGTLAQKVAIFVESSDAP
mgnify:CR=1 FL=1